MVAEQHANGEHDEGRALGFNDLLLGAVVLFIVLGVVLAATFYILPGEHLEIPQAQPAVRVAREADFPVASSRMVRWGERAILVIRWTADRFVAVQGTAPSDGCLLEWEEEALRIVSPCSYVVYDLKGRPVTGLSTRPLQGYPVFLRDGVVYVGRG